MKTAAPYSIASLHSIFSVVYPCRHGVNGYYKMFRFKENEITSLAEYLQESNYYTSCDIIDEKFDYKPNYDEFVENYSLTKIIKSYESVFKSLLKN